MTRWGSVAANQDGAVAPTVALSLFALIGVGGLAFDYARVASVDTELQQAADQAALAAATQLDRQAGSTSRAVAAAQSMLTNETRFAARSSAGELRVATGEADVTDASNPVARVKFYSTKADAEADTNGYVASAAADLTARFVQVAVTGRKAVYALTPIIGAFESGTINAKAAAGLGSAICKVPPVMICNPAEPTNNTNQNLDWNVGSNVGKGLRLISVGNGPSAWAPGDFGYLDVDSPTSNPNVELRQALGWTTAPGDCSGLEGVRTRTGAGTPVTQAINTRFDIYEKPSTGNGNAASCPSGAICPPSINTVKDVLRKGNAGNGGKCGLANNEWELPPAANRYLPTSTADLTQAQADVIRNGGTMGHPRDKCHALSINGSCNGGKLGDGNWDRNAYFRVNYGWTSTEWPNYLNSGVASTRIPTTTSPTRYQVYLWEIANRGTTIGGVNILSNRYPSGTQPADPVDHDAPVCSPLQTPNMGTGVVPGGTNVDRRRISAAVINCSAYNVHGGGNTVYPVLKWIDLFLVEPSINRDRTDANDVYVEIIGETRLGGGATAGQVVRRDKPYLVR